MIGFLINSLLLLVGVYVLVATPIGWAILILLVLMAISPGYGWPYGGGGRHR